MNTRLKLLANAAPSVKERLELIDQFDKKFGESPIVDPDSMSRSQWTSLVKQSLETGEIPAQLRNRMGFVTSIREVTQEEEPCRRKAQALVMFEERNLEGDEEMVIGRATALPPNAKWPFPKASSSAQSPQNDNADN
ncbi:MAG: hypothetical protein J7605_14410 [Variovorax sp.]|nr:hypothetical protein [Variovorax sp.]